MFTVKIYRGGGYTAYSTPAYELRSFPDRARMEIVLFDLRSGDRHELEFEVPENSEESITLYVENDAGKTIDRVEILWDQAIRKV